MKSLISFLTLSFLVLAFVACEKDSNDDSDPKQPPPPPIAPEVDEYFSFRPTSTEDTAKWNTESDFISFGKIPSSLTSSLVLNCTFDNTIENAVNNGIIDTLLGTPGNYYIKVKDNATNDLYDEKYFTVCAWIKLGLTSGEQTILSKRYKDATNDDVGYVLSQTNGIPSFSMTGKHYSSNSSMPVTVISNIENKTEWVFVTAVFETGGVDDSIKLYINGELNLTETIPGVSVKWWRWNESRETTTDKTHFITFDGLPKPVSDNNLYIGNSADGNTPFKGYIDQVMIFNTDLDAAEVKELYGLKQ